MVCPHALRIAPEPIEMPALRVGPRWPSWAVIGVDSESQAGLGGAHSVVTSRGTRGRACFEY